MPFIGTWSDKCTGSFALRFGRRRPFVVVGCLLSTCGLVLLRLASTFPMVVLGFAVLIAGNVTSWVPYMTVLPEVVPATQRGVAASYQMVVDSISWGLGSGLGVAVGQKLISEDQTYLLLIVLNLSLPERFHRLSQREGSFVQQALEEAKFIFMEIVFDGSLERHISSNPSHNCVTRYLWRAGVRRGD